MLDHSEIVGFRADKSSNVCSMPFVGIDFLIEYLVDQEEDVF